MNIGYIFSESRSSCTRKEQENVRDIVVRALASCLRLQNREIWQIIRVAGRAVLFLRA